MPGFHILVVLSLVATLAVLVYGQDFIVPQDWRKPNLTVSRPDCISRAQAVTDYLLNASINTIGADPWTHANIPASLAQYDYISGTQNYHSSVSLIFTAEKGASEPGFFDDSHPLQNYTANTLMWGLAAFYGSRAYGNDSYLLSIAVDVWNVAQAYAVSAQDAATGTQPAKNATFRTNCVSNGTSAGAVFWVSSLALSMSVFINEHSQAAFDPTDMRCNAETVGAYVALSAHLWRTTGNQKYLDAADQSANFMYTHMYLADSHVILDTYNLGDCSSSGPGTYTYNQGFLLEGLSILRSAPISDSTLWTSFLQTLVNSTVRYPAWTASSDNLNIAGIITEGDEIDPTEFQEKWVFRNAFIRALYEIWSQATQPDPMADFIRAFLAVQFNALLDLASNNGVYSPVWVGTNNLQTEVLWGQLSASEVLNSAINMSTTSTITSSSMGISTPTAAISTHTSTSLSGGEIAGIAVGASVAVFAAIAGCIMCLIRRRRHRRAGAEVERDTEPTSYERYVEPFPPSHPINLRREEIPGAPGFSKIRSDGPEVFANSTPQLTDSVVPVLSTDGPAHIEPSAAAGTQDTALRRLIQQVISSMHQEAPPQYTGPDSE